jgi:hypothetical protein
MTTVRYTEGKSSKVFTLSKSDVTLPDFDPKMMERLFDVIEKTSWRDLPDDISKWISTVSDGNVNFIEMNQTPFSYTLFGCVSQVFESSVEHSRNVCTGTTSRCK